MFRKFDACSTPLTHGRRFNAKESISNLNQVKTSVARGIRSEPPRCGLRSLNDL